MRRPTADDVAAAWEVIRHRFPPAPLDVSHPDVTLKLESLQPTGSFKVRGALNALAAVPDGVPVVTASAGNHALGVALAAQVLGREATIVVSEKASPAKTAALSRFPVRLVRRGSSFDDAEAHALELADRGAYYVSAYNDPFVIAGQGTIGVELDAQTTGPLTVVCGIGGGGLASGLALWAAGRDDVRIVGVEAEASTAVSAAVRAGHQVNVEVGDTLADGMAGNIEPGAVTVDIIAEHVSALLTVTEEEIRAAIRHLASEHGLVAEGAGAVSIAAVLAGKVPAEGRTVAVLSGRNIAGPAYARVLHPGGRS